MNSYDTYRQRKVDHIVNSEFPKYIKLLEDCFDFERWGFQLIFSGGVPQSNPSIVYESQKCRVRFMWEIPDYRDSLEITYILYGRLHASVFQEIMDWKGKKCHCWHDAKQALNFLDGLTPQEAFKNVSAPVFMSTFYEENKTKGWRQSEMQARRQAAVWKLYGHNLFNLFDLHYPDLWQKYSDFIKEFYSLGRTWPDNSRVPLYKIC